MENLPPGSGVQRSLVRSATLLSGIYIAAQMLSDIASLKIAVVAGLAVDAGTFIYPITFTLRDLIHKRLGKSAARTVIILAAGINLAMAGYLWLVSALPADAAWTAWEGAGVTANDAFARILAPAWTIVLASIAAEVVSELIDTEVYHLWTTRVTERLKWSRVLVSNAASVPVDSLIFSWLAFGWGLGMPAAQVWEIFWFNVAVKGAVTLASLPGIYLVRQRPTQ
ncbi:MAG: queuosine precursor transporter [Treponema sp.]|nr:queuosine precursor transporter [Treponema sp.]